MADGTGTEPRDVPQDTVASGYRGLRMPWPQGPVILYTLAQNHEYNRCLVGFE